MKIPVGSKAMVAGWGATEPDSIRRPKELQAVDVNVVDNSQCENWHASKGINVSQYNYIFNSSFLCAKYDYTLIRSMWNYSSLDTNL